MQSKSYHIPIRNIFIADDDTDDQMLFQQALEEVDPQIRLEKSKDGNELVSLLQNFKPDLLFLDLDMPAKNGLECLKFIRTNPVYADLPVIVFSSTSRQSNIDVAYEMGAHLFFIKPSFFQDLVSTIRAILQLNWALPNEVKNQFFADGVYTTISATDAGLIIDWNQLTDG